MRLLEIVEVSSHVSPARRLHATVLVELIESCIGIGLKYAAKLLQMPLRIFAFAIRRVSEPNRRRSLVARRSLLATVGKLTAPVMLLQAANDYSLASTQAMADDLSRLSKAHLRKVYPPTGETANDGHNFLYADVARWEPDVFKFLDENVRH